MSETTDIVTPSSESCTSSVSLSARLQWWYCFFLVLLLRVTLFVTHVMFITLLGNRTPFLLKRQRARKAVFDPARARYNEMIGRQRIACTPIDDAHQDKRNNETTIRGDVQDQREAQVRFGVGAVDGSWARGDCAVPGFWVQSSSCALHTSAGRPGSTCRRGGQCWHAFFWSKG